MIPDGCPLTEKEYEAMALVADGRTYREVGEILDVDWQAVVQRVRSAQRRLGVEDRWEAVQLFLARDWDLAPDPPMNPATEVHVAAWKPRDVPPHLLKFLRLIGVS